jgi:hypothetical protein
MNPLEEARKLLWETQAAWAKWGQASADPLATRRKIAMQWANLLSDFLARHGATLDSMGASEEVDRLGEWYDRWAQAAQGLMADEKLADRERHALWRLFGKGAEAAGHLVQGLSVGTLGAVAVLLVLYLSMEKRK